MSTTSATDNNFATTTSHNSDESKVSSPVVHTLTIFAHGTGQTQESTGGYRGIIHQFVGALNARKASLNSNSLLNTIFKNKKTGAYNAAVYLDGPQGARDQKAIEDNIEAAIHEIKVWAKNKKPGDKLKLNLAGFSRGAVTARRIANRLANEIKKGKITDYQGNPITANDIDALLFEIDPVAGLGDKAGKGPGSHEKASEEITKIPEIVKEHIAVLSENEERGEFKPQDMTRTWIENPSKTKSIFVTLAGDHNDPVALYNPDPNLRSTPIIVWHILYQKLKQRVPNLRFPAYYGIPAGTAREEQNYKQMPISDRLELDKQYFKNLEKQNSRLLKEYAIMKANDKGYKKEAGSRFLPRFLPKAKRSFLKYLKYYTPDPFFINQHERELFKVIYPALFNYLFEQNLSIEGEPSYSRIQAEEELNRLKKDHSEVYQAFIAAGKLKKQENTDNTKNNDKKDTVNPIKDKEINKKEIQGNEDNYMLPDKPQGFYCREPLYVLSEGNKSICPLEAVKKDIFHQMLHYQRKKPEYYHFLSQRTEAIRAQEIMEETFDIIYSEKTLCYSISDKKDNDRLVEDKNKKKEAVLDNLERHYQELVVAGSRSKLRDTLEDILKNNGRIYKPQENPSLSALIPHTVGRVMNGVGDVVKTAARILSVPFLIAAAPFHFVGGLMKESSRPKPVKIVGHLLDGIAKVILLPTTLLEMAGHGLKEAGKAIKRKSGAITVKRENTTSAETAVANDTTRNDSPKKVVSLLPPVTGSQQEIKQQETERHTPVPAINPAPLSPSLALLKTVNEGLEGLGDPTSRSSETLPRL